MTSHSPFEEFERMFAEMDRQFARMRRSLRRTFDGEDEATTLGPIEDEMKGFGPIEEPMDRRDGTLAAGPIEQPIRSFGPIAEPMAAFAGFESDVRMDYDDETGEYVVVADLPGFETDELDVTIHGELLSIEAVHEVEDGAYSGRRSFRRRMTLPRGVEVDDVTASYRNGVLELRLPTMESEPDRRIEIDE